MSGPSTTKPPSNTIQWLLAVASLSLSSALIDPPSRLGLSAREAFFYASLGVLDSREISDPIYSNYLRRVAYAPPEPHLRLRLRSPYPQRKSQDQANKEALDRVNTSQRNDKDAAAKNINDEHAKANNIMDQANASEKKTENELKKAQEYAKAHPDDKKAQNGLKGAAGNADTAKKNGEWEKTNEPNTELKNDAKAVDEFNTKSKDSQNKAFNKNGDAKSAEQQAKERARAGFLKFLEIFGEVASLLAGALPGPGQLLSVGIRLRTMGARIGKDVADVVKVAKAGMKAEKFGQDLRKVLDVKDGKQEIQGIAGDRMAEVQRQFLGELLDLLGKNAKATEKKVEETKKEVPQAPLPVCKGPRVQRCRVQRRGLVWA